MFWKTGQYKMYTIHAIDYLKIYGFSEEEMKQHKTDKISERIMAKYIPKLKVT